MATIVLAAVGAAVGGSIGGAVLGVSAAVIGRAVGATLGSVIDQRLMGAGSAPVEVGKIDRFRIMGSSEGTPIPRVFGRMRVAGQVIWSSKFRENVSKSGGGKGGPPKPEVTEYSYSISFAIALCEGEISRIGRVWADGQPISLDDINWRLYRGSEDQNPDPVIAAIEGNDAAPAYRGTAYIVFEDLDLAPFGNRIPQLNFEVIRRPFGEEAGRIDPAQAIKAVALVPGTGEYALATEKVEFRRGKGLRKAVNTNSDDGRPDFNVSLEHLENDLPNCRSVSLVVSWFGDDLRCGQCGMRPKVEQKADDGDQMPWKVSGLPRAQAQKVQFVDGRPGFGGTPADESVMQAIRRLNQQGKEVVFYPFVLMDIRAGNGLIDPWTGLVEQNPVPWRGRITTSLAPSVPGTPDKTSAAGSEVDSFFGDALRTQFQPNTTGVSYSGPAEWSYRRFILHYAHLCKKAGGVSAFCIGSELRALTQVRDGAGSFPAVQALRALAADVRAILGPDTKIGYAADWSEYFGYHTSDGSGDVYYHLDDLWADPAIDFIGIDNYMPLSDWRDGLDHADAGSGSIYDIDYLRGNVAGGEGFDWYYKDIDARVAQIRAPITDGAYGDPWVFRYKDIRNWWSRPHWNRPGGVRDAVETAWIPASKPIWFTELGCPAVDKGSNQPNVFVDQQSSESAVPYFSNGGQDDYIQICYLQAVLGYWNDPANNPVSPVYDEPMVDMARAHVWAWDTRPWPDFPQRVDLWSDGGNHARGHWISGRNTAVTLADVVREICLRSNLADIDVSRLYGLLKGYVIGGVESARQSLQPLMLAHGFDCFDQGGGLVFRNRSGRVVFRIDPDRLVVEDKGTETISMSRSPLAESADLVRIGFVNPDADYLAAAVEAGIPGEREPRTSLSELPMALGVEEGRAIADRWLSEARVARDQIRFRVPMSDLSLGAGDVVALDRGARELLFRVDRIEDTGARQIEAVRIEAGIYEAAAAERKIIPKAPRVQAEAVYPEFLDLPLLRGDEVPHAPHLAVTGSPWPGTVAVFSSATDSGYQLNTTLTRNATMGDTLTPFAAARPAQWSGAELMVRLASGTLQSRSREEVLNGANVAAIRFGGVGDWEVIQFEVAEIVAPMEYRLSGFLRGQSGTDGVMPEILPAGSDFVLLDGSAVQIDLGMSARGLARHYRVGTAAKSYDDVSYSHIVAAFQGVGLRPYAPVHLRAQRNTGGAVALNWVRRTRLDGDGWEGLDVPLGEDREQYSVRIYSGTTLLRNATEPAAQFTYSTTQQAADGAPSSIRFEVAQLSDRFGAGPYARIDFNE